MPLWIVIAEKRPIEAAKMRRMEMEYLENFSLMRVRGIP
jgi:hypothetical protein